MSQPPTVYEYATGRAVLARAQANALLEQARYFDRVAEEHRESKQYAAEYLADRAEPFQKLQLPETQFFYELAMRRSAEIKQGEESEDASASQELLPVPLAVRQPCEDGRAAQ